VSADDPDRAHRDERTFRSASTPQDAAASAVSRQRRRYWPAGLRLASAAGADREFV